MMEKIIDNILVVISQMADNLAITPHPIELTEADVDRLMQEISNEVQQLFNLNNNHKKLTKMEDKKPTTTEDRRHEVRPEHETLREAMAKWSEEAADGERRSVIVIQVIEKDGELTASSHINGNGQHLHQATKACMSTLSPDNSVGSILRQAAIDSLIEIGMLAPCEESPKQEQPETETNKNNENE